MNQKNRPDSFVIGIIAVCALIVGMFIGVVGRDAAAFVDSSFKRNTSNTIDTQIQPQSNGVDFYDAAYIQKVLNIFEQRYIKDINPDQSKEYTYGIIKGFIDSLDDQYTFFYTPEEAKEYYDQRSPDFEGIGVTLGYNEEGAYTYVESVLQGLPADKNGILPQDIIYKVDSEDMSGKRPEEVAPKIRGEKGSVVSLAILRENNGQLEEQNFSITRETIQIDNIQWEKIDDVTAHITIVQFTDDTVAEFNANWTKVVNEVQAQMPGLQNIVVDLRNNPGGYVSGVQFIMEEFLPTGAVLMREKSKAEGVVTYTDKRGGAFEDEKVVILVNEGSASASEIFSAGLKENNRATIVGMPTVGKGVEQELIELGDGSILLLVFQQWLTPNSNEISEDNPVKPDHEVDYTLDDYKQDKDPQMDKALELLK